MKALTFVEIDIPYCANTYGVAPCTASIPTTGAVKCFNCLATCQDTAHLIDAPVTLRFAFPTTDLPSDIECIPSLGSIDHTPNVISLGSDLGERASLSVTFKDHPWSDTPNGFDKYFATRTYDPYTQGTFWGKFRARQPYLKGSALRLITGLVGQDIEDMETRHFLIDSFSGPTLNGMFRITAKDVIKLADGDKAQAPVASQGYLLSDILAVATTLTLTPSGIGNLEYDASGYICIAANEVCSYTRDPFTKFLMHFDAADASITFTDSSPVPHTFTAGGNAQIDTAQFKFGSASLLLDGTGDYLLGDGSSDYAFGSSDFTIELWIRFNALSGAIPSTLYDSRPNATEGLYPDIYISTLGKLKYYVNSADRITGTTTLVTGQWYHVSVCRASGNTKMFLNGTQEGSTYVDANVYLNGATRPVWGTNGTSLGGTPLNGWIDEAMVKNGLALRTANFTAPTTAPDLIGSGDAMIIARGLFNTTAAAHSANDKVQKCLYYNAQTAPYIINDLLVTYTNIDASYINLTAWQLEATTYLQRVFTTILTEPTSVKQLIDELITEGGLAIWPDDIGQAIRFQVLRAIAPDADTLTDDIYKRGSLGISEQENKRLTQVWVHYARINPTLALDRIENYRSVDIRIDEDAENNYGVPAIKKIFSRWIPQGGRAIAQRISDIWLARYVVPPRKFSLDLMRYGPKEVVIGGGYYITSPHLQDESGAQLTRPFQVTQLQVTDTTLKVVGEENNWQSFAYDGSERVITIDTNNYNLNMKTLHDALYPTIVGGETVILIIAANAKVGSTSTAVPALDIGAWPILPTLKLYVYGKLEGRGGNGGDSGTGFNGGDALKTTVAITLFGDGDIWSGGGGGGGIVVRGGGGGAGINPGTGGSGGNDGTELAGGTGGSVSEGTAGSGGAPGVAGATSASGNAGGNAGKSINGVANVTNSSTVDIQGPTA